MHTKDGMTANGPEFVAFLRSSKLENPTLQKIWKHCVKDSATTMDRLGFFKCMRMVALSQNCVETAKFSSYLMATNFPYLPKFDNISVPPIPYNYLGDNIPDPETLFPDITAEELIQYEDFVNTVTYLIFLILGKNCCSRKPEGF